MKMLPAKNAWRPPPVEMVKQTVQTVNRVVNILSSEGSIAVSSEQKEANLATCHACDKYYQKANGCRVCGCPVSIRTKFKGGCPAGKF
jgi:rRNA maturation endonuclease Nob1